VLIQASPKDPPLVSALRHLLADQPAEAAVDLQQCDKADQALVFELLQSAACYAESGRDPGKGEERLQALRSALQARAPLALGTVCFCDSIWNYGVYKKLDPNQHHFQAGMDNRPGERMLLYVEVRNSHSEPRDGAFETRLATTISIADEKGQVVQPAQSLVRLDRSLSPRQDYLIKLEVPVPASARAGPYPYTLLLEVRDETPPPPGSPATPRVARRSLFFYVDECAPRDGEARPTPARSN
jgi:hypothetical protein